MSCFSSVFSHVTGLALLVRPPGTLIVSAALGATAAPPAQGERKRDGVLASDQ
eukprot:COSAG01_NODE_59670_length_299_cov_0.675000_1_plen_52_part_01